MAGFDPVGSTPVAALGGHIPGGYYPAAGPLIFKGAVVFTSPAFAIPGPLIFKGAAPSVVLAQPRATWFGLEVSHVGAASGRVTTVILEVSHSLPSSFKPAAGPLVFTGAKPFASPAFPGGGPLIFTGAAPQLRQPRTPAAGPLIFAGATPGAIIAQPRVTWAGLEVSHVGAASGRVTWSGLEVSHEGAASGRVTTMILEVSRTILTVNRQPVVFVTA